MFSTWSFVFGVFTVIVWYIWQDLKIFHDATGDSRLHRLVNSLMHKPQPDRTEKRCTCGAVSQLMRALIQMNRSQAKQLLIFNLRKELGRAINEQFNGYVQFRLIHFTMGPYLPTILSIKRVPDEELSVRAEVEYLGAASLKFRLSLPFIENTFHLETKLTLELIMEKFTATTLVTFSSIPYEHIRLSLESMPRWFIRKKIFTPTNREIHSKIVSWFVDFALTASLRSRLIQPIFIMNEKLLPSEWSMLQIQEAVFSERFCLELTFEKILRVFPERKRAKLVMTVEPNPWIHMDLVNLTPIANFTLELFRKASLYPGLILMNHDHIDVSEEVSERKVIVRSVLPDSAADEALFLEGDLIISVDGEQVNCAQQAAELLDATEGPIGLVRVQRVVHFKWSRSVQRMVPVVEWLSHSDLKDIYPYPQSESTTNRNFESTLGSPGEIVENAISHGYRYLSTDEFDLAGGINETLRIPMSKQKMYISFGIWSMDELIGYGSMLLNACIGHCQETSGPLTLQVPLGHPNDMKASPLARHLRPYRDVPGFNVRLSHGEIVMKLQTTYEK